MAGLVLLTTASSTPQPARSIAEDRYRDILQAIARGRPDNGDPIRSAEAQNMARRVLIEMGADWTKRGAA